MNEKAVKRRLRVRLWQQLPLLVVLVVLWMLLWGNISLLNLVTGAILAVLVTRVFFLPPIDLSGRFNVWWFLVLALDFARQLFTASFQVAAQAFYRRPGAKNAVIGVQLATRSDLMMTLTAIAISLIPGSLVVEADREKSILYLHVFNTPDLEAVESARSKVLHTEMQIARALGSREDLERVRS